MQVLKHLLGKIKIFIVTTRKTIKVVAKFLGVITSHCPKYFIQ